MSLDWIVQAGRPAELEDVVRAADRTEPHLRLGASDDEEWITLADRDGRARLWIAPARPVVATYETQRVVAVADLDDEALPYWIEVVAPDGAGGPLDPGPFARALAVEVGGQAVDLSAAPVDA